jgi:hypothetical protein
MLELLGVNIGLIKPSLFALSQSSSQIIFESIYTAFESEGIRKNDILTKRIEYLNSIALMTVPFIKINSMLWAALARKASSGRKKPPNQGMANDITLLSLIIPYCDAMFIDNECRSYLTEMPLKTAINYGTRFFSQNNKDEFINYLDEIKFSASKEHLDKVKEVYGDIR